MNHNIFFKVKGEMTKKDTYRVCNKLVCSVFVAVLLFGIAEIIKALGIAEIGIFLSCVTEDGTSRKKLTMRQKIT